MGVGWCHIPAWFTRLSHSLGGPFGRHLISYSFTLERDIYASTRIHDGGDENVDEICMRGEDA